MDRQNGTTYTGADSTGGNLSTSPFGSLPQYKGKYLADLNKRKRDVAKVSGGDPKQPDDIRTSCKAMGMPTMMVSPYAVEIIQTPTQINWSQEFLQETRRIYLDGRPHPNPAEQPPTFEGHSIGRWDGDTLVVETVNVRPETVLGDLDRSDAKMGHSEKLRIVERLHINPQGLLQVDGTVDDPEAIVKPWSYTVTFRRSPKDDEFMEYVCEDNNVDTVDPITGKEVTRIPEMRGDKKAAN